MNNPRCLVLLATYNGEKYIHELLNSLPFEVDILVSDDCSNDNTISIIESYKSKNIEIRTGMRHGSATQNFRYLINNCNTDYQYYFLADQDDCWSEDKLQTLLEEMNRVEKQNSQIPILIYGDSIVVNERLEIIDESFFNYDGINPNIISRNLCNLFFQNVGQGATMCFNRALLEKVRIMPRAIYMHDWWLMLVAQSFGKLHLSTKRTLKYRQHQYNCIGATSRNLFEQLASQIKGESKIKKHLQQVDEQIKQFATLYSEKIENIDILNFLTEYLQIRRSRNFLRRKWFLLKHGVYLSSFKRTVALYLYF